MVPRAGYASPSQFSRDLKRMYGQTPTAMEHRSANARGLGVKVRKLDIQWARAADVLEHLLAVASLGSGFLSHLHSLVVTMCQKTSLIKST